MHARTRTEVVPLLTFNLLLANQRAQQYRSTRDLWSDDMESKSRKVPALEMRGLAVIV